MKLLYTVILLLQVLQLVRSKSLNVTASSSIVKAKKQLGRFYQKEFNLLTGEVCIELKNIIVQLLKDEIIDKGETSLIQDFKKNITNFQQIYPFYMRFGLNETLASTFSKIVINYYYLEPDANEDALYIHQLIRKLGYSEIRDKYKNEFEEFVSKKFLPKYEELKSQISNKTQLRKFENKFSKCVSTLKVCKEYECYLDAFKENTLSAKDKFYGRVQRQLLDISIRYLANATILYDDMLTDQKLLQFSSQLRQQLAKNVQEFKGVHESLKDINQLFTLTLLHPLIIFNVEMRKYSKKEVELLMNFAQNYVTGDLNTFARTIYGEFLDHGFLKEIEHFRASLNHEELIKEKSLLDALDSIKEQRNFEKTLAIMENLQIVSKKELQKRRF